MTTTNRHDKLKEKLWVIHKKKKNEKRKKEEEEEERKKKKNYELWHKSTFWTRER